MIWILLLGIVTGMRAMTGIAVVCWAAWLGWLPEHGWAMPTTYLVSAIVFTVLAIGEYIGDTLSRTPSRKAAGPAASRLVFGALVGALGAASIQEPLVGGVLSGLIGAAIGTWGGFAARRRGAALLGRDLPVALAESGVALALAIVAVWNLHQGILDDLRRGAV